jgi:hypothetical protein
VSGSRGTAVTIALIFGALVAAGCGLGPGKGLGDVELTVTREYGAVPVLHGPVGDVTESDTVMRVLERQAEITTRYSGGFVQSIEGVEAGERGGDSYDWFFYVNGVESTVGAASFPLHGGERIWWDYRDWSGAERVPAVVGAFPEPLLSGYDGKPRPVAVECMGGGEACAVAREKLAAAGVSIASGSPDGAIRILVGPWDRVRDDPAAAQIEAGPQTSGVFADFSEQDGGFELQGLDQSGDATRSFGPDAGLVAATRRYEAQPVWVVTGADRAGTLAAAELLTEADLRDHYAVATEGGAEAPLPTR